MVAQIFLKKLHALSRALQGNFIFQPVDDNADMICITFPISTAGFQPVLISQLAARPPSHCYLKIHAHPLRNRSCRSSFMKINDGSRLIIAQFIIVVSFIFFCSEKLFFTFGLYISKKKYKRLQFDVHLSFYENCVKILWGDSLVESLSLTLKCFHLNLDGIVVRYV